MFVTSLDLPAAEHVEIVADAVEQGERIGCDEQGPPLAAELQDQLLHDENAFGVESAKRFVEQQDPFALHQQQDQRQPFPLVGRQSGGFGGGRRTNPNAPQRGESIRMSIAISFEEAAFGCEKEITVERIETCDDCGGTGAAKGTTAETCPNCRGTGVVTQTQRTPLGMFQTQGACPNCRGTGKIIKKPCPKCGGQGRVRKTRKFKVNIPAGIDDGQSIQQRGQGNAGANGGPAGDLYVTVAIRPHPIFTRDGSDV